MKKIILISYLSVSLLFFGQVLQVNNTLTPEQLVQNILAGSGVQISNVTFNGLAGTTVDQQCGDFDGTGTNVGILSGLIMASGNIDLAPGPNDQGGASSGSATIVVSDPDLDAISTNNLNDVAVLEFDFIPIGDTISFKYVFASEEYNEYVCSGYNDVFGFFISGPGINGPYSNNAENIAIIPGTNTAVAINTVNLGEAGSSGSASTCEAIDPNWESYNIYYNNNTNDFVQYDGMTQVLTAISPVQCGQTYHIKLAIADAGDGAFDSGVFLEAGSLTSIGVDISLQTVTGDTIIYEGCTNADFIFTRPLSQVSVPLTVNYTLSGTAIENTDYFVSPAGNSVTFNVGEDSVSLTLSTIGIIDATEGNESVIISASFISECGDLITLTKALVITEDPIFNANANNPIVDCPQDSIIATLFAIGGTPPYTYTWFDNLGNQVVIDDTNYVEMLTPGVQTFNVHIVDFCNFQFDYPVTVTLNDKLPLVIDATAPVANCNETTVPLTAIGSGGAAPLTFTWSNGQFGPVVNGSTAGTPPPTYTVTMKDACGDSIQDNVTISFQTYPPLSVSASAPNATCITPTVPMTANGAGGLAPYTYSWSNGQNGQTVNGATTGTPPPTYTVTITDACGETATSSLTIQFDNDPILNISANDVTIQCPNDQVPLSAIASNGFQPYTYTWSDGQIGASINVSIQQNDTVQYTVNVVDVCGNTGTQTLDLILNQTLNIDSFMSGPSHTCVANGFVNPTVIGNTGPVNYYWTGPNGNIEDTITTQNLVDITYGWYYLYVEDNVCQDRDSVFITQILNPIADLSTTKTIANIPQDVTFTNNSQNATSYVWDFGNGEIRPVDNKNDQTSTYDELKDYTVTLTAINGPCSDVATIIVLAEPKVTHYDIFTPNGDSKNDLFWLNPKNFKEFSFQIFNRWGHLMFEGDLNKLTWDGKASSGKDAQDGVYFYKYYGTGFTGTVLEGHGNLQLTR